MTRHRFTPLQALQQELGIAGDQKQQRCIRFGRAFIHSNEPKGKFALCYAGSDTDLEIPGVCLGSCNAYALMTDSLHE